MNRGPDPGVGPYQFDICWQQAGLTKAPSRVVVTGGNGAGKTVAAAAFAGQSGLPLYHKDALALTSNWQTRPAAEVRAALVAIAKTDGWIIDMGPAEIPGLIEDRADLVLWLDPPILRRIWRVFWRSVQYIGRTRPELPPGNRDWPGIRQMRFVTGVWRSRRMVDQSLTALSERGNVPVLRLRDAGVTD